MPLFDPSPALMSVELRCVENDFYILYEGSTHNINFSLAIARSWGLIRVSFLIAKSRALSSLSLASTSWTEGRLLDKNSSSLHAKTPDASSGGAELVCGIGQGEGGDEVEGIKEAISQVTKSKRSNTLRLYSPAPFFGQPRVQSQGRGEPLASEPTRYKRGINSNKPRYALYAECLRL